MSGCQQIRCNSAQQADNHDANLIMDGPWRLAGSRRHRLIADSAARFEAGWLLAGGVI